MIANGRADENLTVTTDKSSISQKGRKDRYGREHTIVGGMVFVVCSGLDCQDVGQKNRSVESKRGGDEDGERLRVPSQLPLI